MSKSDIGWIDKDQISDTLRNLKKRKRPRTATQPKDDDQTYVDLLGQKQTTAHATPETDGQSLLLQDEKPTITRATTTPPPATKVQTPVQRTAATTHAPAPTAQPPRDAQNIASKTKRSTTPTDKLVTTPNALEDEPVQSAQHPGEPIIPGARPSTEQSTQSTAYAPTRPRQTATLETTPTRAQESDDADLGRRFQDAFDVLRSPDQHRLQDRYPTAEITPTTDSASLPATDTHPAYEEALALDAHTHPAVTTTPDEANDLTLSHQESTPNTPTEPALDDLKLKDTSTHATTPDPHAQSNEDDALSLPGHDLDLTIHTSSPRVLAYDDDHDTQDLSGDLVFESDDFLSEQSEQTNDTTEKTLHIPDPEETYADLEDAETQPTQIDAPQTPEHTFVPKIHSQILRTVRRRTAPDPAQYHSAYAWFKAFYAWMKSAETPSTQFLVADHAGLSLLDTGVDPHTVAVAVATRKSMDDLRERDQKNTAGFTVFRHTNDRYMNLVWAPSPHGTITLGILSNQVYSDESLAAFEDKLVRAIETLPFT